MPPTQIAYCQSWVCLTHSTLRAYIKQITPERAAKGKVYVSTTFPMAYTSLVSGIHRQPIPLREVETREHVLGVHKPIYVVTTAVYELCHLLQDSIPSLSRQSEYREEATAASPDPGLRALRGIVQREPGETAGFADWDTLRRLAHLSSVFLSEARRIHGDSGEVQNVGRFAGPSTRVSGTSRA